MSDTSDRPTTPPDSAADAVLPAQDAVRSEESLAYLMRRILSLFRQAVARELEGTGLTQAQWVPLLKLHLGCASTVAELARSCDLDAGSMTRLLDRLEAKQLCRRVRSQVDRRVVHIELTAAGVAAAQQIPAILRRVQDAHMAGFGEEERVQLRNALRRILDTALALHASADIHDPEHS